METSPHAWAWAPSREASRQSAPQEPRKESEGGRVSAQFVLPRALLSPPSKTCAGPRKGVSGDRSVSGTRTQRGSRGTVEGACVPHTCVTRVSRTRVPLVSHARTCPTHVSHVSCTSVSHSRVPCTHVSRTCAPHTSRNVCPTHTRVTHVPRTHVSHAHACPAHMCRTRVPCTRVPRTHMSHTHVSHTCPTHTWPVSFPTGPARSSASSCAAKPPPRSTSTARPSWQTTFSAPLTPTCSRSSSCR